MTLKENLFSFRGRITRKEYWVRTLALCAIAMMTVLVTNILIARVAGGGVAAVAFLVCFLPIYWMMLAVSVKRCHDRGKSGWWMLLWMILSVVPYVGLLVGLWWIAELGFLDGTQGPNRFGPSPKGLGADRIADAFA